MNEIRHIVFDLGNVLLRWDPERPFLRLIPDPVARRLERSCWYCNGLRAQWVECRRHGREESGPPRTA